MYSPCDWSRNAFLTWLCFSLVGQPPWPRAQFDLVFLDHHKDLYLPDAKLLYRVGGIAHGTVIFADNVIFPGCPDYLAWARETFTKSTFIAAEVEYTSRGGRWEVRHQQPPHPASRCCVLVGLKCAKFASVVREEEGRHS